MIVHAVNDENFTENKLITLKYFESGNTFKAADSTHAKIKKVLKRKDGMIFYFHNFRLEGVLRRQTVTPGYGN